MKRNLVLLSLAVLVLGVGTASAQVTYQLTTVPTFVIDTGRAEVLGSVRITATNSTMTIASTIQYLFQAIGCDNNDTTGISLLGGAPFTPGVNIFIASVTNTSAGCVVSVTVDAALATTAGTSFIELGGVRGRIDLTAAAHPNHGANINASMSATPSNSSLFTVPNQGVVGISAHGMEVIDVNLGSCLQCISPCTAVPDITIQEGFNGAFVDHGGAVGNPDTTAPAGFRPFFGANTNTQIRIVLTGLPTGITISWGTVGTTTFPATTGAVGDLLLTSQSTSGDTITLRFETTDQSISDITLEDFLITPASITIAGTAGFGTATIQATLHPGLVTGDATSLTSAPNIGTSPGRPRFNPFFERTPADPFISNGPCVTNLLFPFVANIAGFDTGFAFANTSGDNLAFGADLPLGVSAAPQSGTCTLNLWPTAAPTSPVATTTASIPAGGTGTVVMSSVSSFAGQSGFVIAVCNFQFAHGFAFIVDNFGVGAPATSQGYLALIIPDPTLSGGRAATEASCTSVSATPGIVCIISGEGLNN